MGKFLDLVGVNLLKEKIIAKIPTKVSELENDKGFITSGNGISETISTTEPEINDSDARWIEPLE